MTRGNYTKTDRLTQIEQWVNRGCGLLLLDDADWLIAEVKRLQQAIKSNHETFGDGSCQHENEPAQ